MADLDGDGRDEPMIFRKGQWFIDLEGDGYSGERAAVSFGLTGDQPFSGRVLE